MRIYVDTDDRILVICTSVDLSSSLPLCLSVCFKSDTAQMNLKIGIDEISIRLKSYSFCAQLLYAVERKGF